MERNGEEDKENEKDIEIETCSRIERRSGSSVHSRMERQTGKGKQTLKDGGKEREKRNTESEREFLMDGRDRQRNGDRH